MLLICLIAKCSKSGQIRGLGKRAHSCHVNWGIPLCRPRDTRVAAMFRDMAGVRNKLRDLLANDSDMEMGQAVVKIGENYGFCDD